MRRRVGGRSSSTPNKLPFDSGRALGTSWSGSPPTPLLLARALGRTLAVPLHRFQRGYTAAYVARWFRLRLRLFLSLLANALRTNLEVAPLRGRSGSEHLVQYFW